MTRIIYQANKSKSHGEVVVAKSGIKLSKLSTYKTTKAKLTTTTKRIKTSKSKPKSATKRAGKVVSEFFRLTTSSLIVVAIASLVFSFGPVITEELTYLWYGPLLEAEELAEKAAQISTVSETVADDLADVQVKARDFGVNSSFSIAIPKINAASNIIANVDASNDKEYLKALKDGVAHAEGTYFPGQGKKVYLFSHSTDSPINILRYNAVFFLLRKLEVGDTIIVFFSDKEYRYVVTKKLITEPEDISWLTENSTSEELLLQTCDPPGTTLKRLIVVAVPEKQ